MTKFFFSQTLGDGSPFRNRSSDPSAPSHDNYARLASLYSKGLHQLGEFATIEAPSIYQTRESLEIIGAGPSSIHFAVRSMPEFRPLYGLPNYLIFDGSLEQLDREVPGSLRTGEEILKSTARVLCTTLLLAEALRARGLCNAVHLPPPMRFRPSKSGLPLSASPPGGGPQVPLAAIFARARSVGGRVIYWDAHDTADDGEALGIIIDLAVRLQAQAPNCLFVVGNPLDRGIDAQYRIWNLANLCKVSGEQTSDEQQSLASSCDVFIRTSRAEGLDLDVLAAVENGVLTLVPEGHSATELAATRLLLTFQPNRERPRWSARKHLRCPGLVRAVEKAVEVPLSEYALLRDYSRAWVGSNHGSDAFVTRLKSAIGAA